MKAINASIDGKRVLIVLSKRICEECLEEYQPLSQRTRFCSHLCMKRCTRRKSREDSNQRLHGGERAKLIQRNGLICSKCGKEGSSYNIVAHHVTFNPKDHSHQELLCRSCHCRIHHSVPKKDISREKMEEALESSRTIVEAQKKLGISKETFFRKRKEFGLEFRNKKNEKIIPRNEIIMAIKTNRTMKEAADSLGIDRTTLYDKKKKFGIVL